jgi:transcriptional/translational regulatory protein YebC/TACO1
VESVRYEGYGPGGAAVLADCLTADRERTANELRSTFSRHGGYLGATGAVSYLFHEVGRMIFRAPLSPGLEATTLETVAFDAEAEEVLFHADGEIEVLTAPADLERVRAALLRRGFEASSNGLTLHSATVVPVRGAAAAMLRDLLATLESHEDVQRVYSNAEISDALLARLPA